MARIMAVVIFCFFPAWAAAQGDGRRDRMSAMHSLMPTGAGCADLDWEPVSYCRLHSKGATLEIWSGSYGPGATLSFDSVGNEGFALMPAIRAHFLLAGVAIEKLNKCIESSGDLQVQISGKLLELRCRFVELMSSASLEIVAQPTQ